MAITPTNCSSKDEMSLVVLVLKLERRKALKECTAPCIAASSLPGSCYVNSKESQIESSEIFKK